MSFRPSFDPRRALLDARWHVAALVALSVGYESLFLHHGLNLLDEGWPLYAAMRLHAGGTLYDDVFFVFPPGHLLAAWLGYALDPPGILVARAIYAGFNVALVIALYALARRLVPAGWAFLAAALLAVSSPYSHLAHFHFGFRYLAWSTLALLAFSQRLEKDDVRWLFAAGLAAGAALCFRLTPAFAASCGVGAGILAASRSWRTWLRDGGLYAAGLLLVAAPVTLWFARDVGVLGVWREVATRAVVMTDLQSLPMPDLELPDAWDRRAVSDLFTAVQFRAYVALYLAYGAAIAVPWLRALARRAPHPSPLLVTVVVWGGVYFVRAFGRADIGHLESAIPPICLLLSHALYSGFRVLERRAKDASRPGRGLELAVGAAFLAAWVFLLGSDRPLDVRTRGTIEIQSLDGAVRVEDNLTALDIDDRVRAIERFLRPDDVLLDLSANPMLHVITGRTGVGYRDIAMPGTFLDVDEERAFVARLERDRPDAVMLPEMHFDNDFDRSPARTAPRVLEWVRRNYHERWRHPVFSLQVPRGTWPEPRPGRFGGDGERTGAR